jgi:hypothetical protein
MSSSSSSPVEVVQDLFRAALRAQLLGLLMARGYQVIGDSIGRRMP